MDIDKFETLYRDCFDLNDNVKSCGRQKCKELITFLGAEYGNAETGKMNVAKIVDFHRALSQDTKQ